MAQARGYFVSYPSKHFSQHAQFENWGIFRSRAIGRNGSRGQIFPSLNWGISDISIYTLSDLGVLSNLIGSLSLANEHYSPPTE